MSIVPLSFKANLIVNNRPRNIALNHQARMLKEDFKKITPKEDKSTLILTINKDFREDEFELLNSRGKTPERYRAILTKLSDEIGYSAMLDRLHNIYRLMVKKSGYREEIEKLNKARFEHTIELQKTLRDKTLKDYEKDRKVLYHKHYIGAIDESIKSTANVAKADCDSFEIQHGLKNVYY